MPKFEPNISFDSNKMLGYVEGIGMALHCHHYLGGFQKMVDLVDYVDGAKIMYQSGERIINNQMLNYYKSHPQVASSADKLEVAADAVRKFGLGVFDFSKCTDAGGTVAVPTSHVAKVLKEKIGKTDKPGGYLTGGLIAGILSAVYGKPVGTYKVSEQSTFADGKETIVYKVEV
jgi:hypothetical protein